jgi:hypothetical protein
MLRKESGLVLRARNGNQSFRRQTSYHFLKDRRKDFQGRRIPCLEDPLEFSSLSLTLSAQDEVQEARIHQ